ncbi:restriction endonuclease subunit S [Enterococcus faecium]|uniref:restriction endonuclease subunit S n=1 Tax=Enterococcus TaxID=1350 RepID=UPI0010C20AB1|nr:restriction endonuclease subunit S [Enterococcus faecium]TKO85047.1 restriction endonuclease subunit S [Enterococcus faecium]TKQ87619.1 restriction endonuclease subunit S [Enterococcus faecium]TKR03869.1 restriction endonuclease subunit S [Enterococcus faecium]
MSNDTQPEIRFPGFTEDWEQRKLSELATMNARIGWQNLRTSEFLDKGDYMLITGTDFKDGAIDYSNIHYVERERFEQDKKIQISNGSILITKDGTLGKVAYVEGLTMPATLNAGVFNVRVKENLAIDSRYLFHYLKAPFLLKFADQRSTGGTIKHLNQNVLVEFPIPLPSLEEQHKVAGLLSNFDNTIALHQRKLDLLKETKKGFLQKMFPKNGAKVPEIRFPGFTEDWEQCKLGDIAKMYQPPTISGSELLDTGYPVFGANGYIGFYSKSNHLEDQVTISARGEGTGTPSYVKAPVWITGNSMVINVEDFDINKKFLYAMLLSYSLKKYITGGAQPQLTRDVLLKVPIIIPSYNEQFKIGTFFKQLDDTIALQQRKLDLLKETKKGFLQKMFV